MSMLAILIGKKNLTENQKCYHKDFNFVKNNFAKEEKKSTLPSSGF